MSVAVSSVSMLVAGLGIAKMASPLVGNWSEGKELSFGVVAVLVIAASYLAASLMVRRSQQQ